MGIAEHRNPVCAQHAGVFETVGKIHLSLIAAGIHQIEIERSHAARTQPVDAGGRSWWWGCSRPIAFWQWGAKVCTPMLARVIADFADQVAPFGSQAARIEFDRPFGGEQREVGVKAPRRAP